MNYQLNAAFTKVDTRNGCVLLIDAATGEWVIVRDREWRQLQSGIFEGIDTDKLSQVGLLYSDCQVATPPRGKGHSGLGLLVLAPTLDCNLGCSYCLIKHENSEPAQMKLEYGTSAIDLLFTSPTSSATVAIDFCGGEPLLAPQLVLELAEYARKRESSSTKNVRLGVQTNGTLVTPELIGEFARLNIKVGLSIDGPASIHDQRRPLKSGGGTHARVLSAYHELTSRGVSTAVIATATSSDEYIQMVEFFLSEGIDFFRLNVVANVGWEHENRTRTDAYADLARSHVQCLRTMQQRGLLQADDWAQQYLKKIVGLPSMMCLRSPCGAGTTQIAILPSGHIVPCLELLELGAMGHISSDDFDTLAKSEIANKLARRTVDNISECKPCAVRNLCASGCPAEPLTAYNDIMKPAVSCQYRKTFITELIWNVYESGGKVLEAIGGIDA